MGYLGGGQLARMLCQSAHEMGLEPHVLSSKENDPAAQVTRHWHQGSVDSADDLKDFLQSVDIATFESEFLNAKTLVEVAKVVKTPIYPSPQLMGLLQDRQSQKSLFDENRLPTAPWKSVETRDEVLDFIDHHDLPIVFKKRFFGYDGYGTFIIKTPKQLNDFFMQEFKPQHFIVEKYIPFKKELAVIIACSLDQSFTHLPLVESFQKEARCDWVKGPMKLKSSKKIFGKLKAFLKRLHYVGVMGVEFFLTSKGLIINEIAPRVHNTGHFSQNTSGPSQFDLHNMCLLGMKLPKEIKIKGGFAMVNLIGDANKVSFQPTTGLHWYGKSENRKGRKMGHINTTGANPNEALKWALKKRQGVKL
jgi:5-(carboxyamino)imidazole ribonucleotide synthase